MESLLHVEVKFSEHFLLQRLQGAIESIFKLQLSTPIEQLG